MNNQTLIDFIFLNLSLEVCSFDVLRFWPSLILNIVINEVLIKKKSCIEEVNYFDTVSVVQSTLSISNKDIRPLDIYLSIIFLYLELLFTSKTFFVPFASSRKREFVIVLIWNHLRVVRFTENDNAPDPQIRFPKKSVCLIEVCALNRIHFTLF